MNNMTIVGAIKLVLQGSNTSMTPRAIFDEIIRNKYYTFGAQNPFGVMRSELRTHSEGIDFPTASSRKFFKYLPDGTFTLLNSDGIVQRKKNVSQASNHTNMSLFDTLKDATSKYNDHIKAQVLAQLQLLKASSFEVFCKKLLITYGFKDVQVTKVSRDGGIDGYGKLKVGLAYFNVAFQCKKWSANVGRPKIDEFRGAIQGDYVQGIYFTTSHFTREALNASSKKGAVPIVLLDGDAIVNLMFERQFGVEREELPIYVSAIDRIFDEE